MDKLIINCQTGKEELVKMTSEEVTQREAESAAASIERAKRDAERERLNKQKEAEHKATQLTVAKLIKADGLADAEIIDMVYLYPAWKPAAEYKTGDMVEYNAKLYEVLKDCIGDEKQKPADTKEIFVSKMPVTAEASK